MNELVKRLSEGEHPIEVSLRPENTVQLLKESIDRGLVHIKFTDTRGGTELGIRLDRNATDFSGGDLEKGLGHIKLVGSLQLNYVDVRCFANIDLQTLQGHGYLELISRELRGDEPGLAAPSS